MPQQQTVEQSQPVTPTIERVASMSSVAPSSDRVTVTSSVVPSSERITTVTSSVAPGNERATEASLAENTLLLQIQMLTEQLLLASTAVNISSIGTGIIQPQMETTSNDATSKVVLKLHFCIMFQIIPIYYLPPFEWSFSR